jgi:hypothetical protein
MRIADETGSLEQVVERRRDPLEPLAGGELAGIGAGNDDDVRPRGDGAVSRGECLTEEPLYSIPVHCAANLSRYRHTQTRGALIPARKRVQDQVAVAVRAPLAVDALELDVP